MDINKLIPEESEEFKVDHIFPQTIGIAHQKKDIVQRWNKELCEYINHQKRRAGFFYKYLHDIPEFKEVTEWVDDNVNKYVEFMKWPDKYVCTESWSHDYPLNAYQPWHAHGGNTISAVYIVWGRPGVDSHLFFKNPTGNDMMNPYNITPNTKSKSFSDIFEANSYPQWGYPSMPGSLYIFRSYLEHMTEQKLNTDRRLILSFNYNREGHGFRPQK